MHDYETLCILTWTHTHAHACTHTQTHTHANAHTHTHTHTYARTQYSKMLGSDFVCNCMAGGLVRPWPDQYSTKIVMVGIF